MISSNYSFTTIPTMTYDNQKNRLYSISSLKTISSLAIGVIGSTYLAYQRFDRWAVALASLEAIQLYTLPKLLRNGKFKPYRLILITQMAALSCLSMGGLVIGSYSLGREILTSFCTQQLSSTLLSQNLKNAFLLTGSIGYAIPLFHVFLEKTHRLIHHPECQKRMTFLFDAFGQENDVKLGFHNDRFIDSFKLQLSLFISGSMASRSHLFGHLIPPTLSVSAAFTLNKHDSNFIDQIIFNIEEHLTNSSKYSSFELKEIEKDFFLSLKIALQTLTTEEKNSLALQWLLFDHAPKIVPDILSKEHFLELFQGEILSSTNLLIDHFFSSMKEWPKVLAKYQKLANDIALFKSDLEMNDFSTMNQSDKQAFHLAYETLKNEKIKILKSIEKIRRKWQCLNSFGSVFQKEDHLPFKKGQEFLNLLHDQNLQDEIMIVHKSLLQVGSEEIPSIHDHFQWINNQLTILDILDSDEVISASLFLAYNHGFVQKDYADLQEWLGIGFLHDIEEGMGSIGLATESDLYAKNILLQSDPTQTKEDIRHRLRQYIKKHKSLHPIDQIQNKNPIVACSLWTQTSEKISRMVFHAIASGSIMVPLFLNIPAASLGFGMGFAYCMMERFKVPGFKWIATELNRLPEHNFLQSLVNRRAFSINQRQAAAQDFINGDCLSKVRTIFECFINPMALDLLNRGTPIVRGLGSFIQGITLSREIAAYI